MVVSYCLLLETEDRKVDTKERKVFFGFFLSQVVHKKKPEGNFPSVIHEGWEDLTSLKVRH